MAVLLVGIVALNVVALSFNADSSRTAALSDQLRQENQALRADITGGLSNERLQRVAARMGLVVPEPGLIRYLSPSPGDAAAAAARLRQGAITVGVVAPIAPLVAETSTVVEAPVVDPGAPVVTAEPTAPEAPVTETAAVPATPAVATGGAVAP